MLLLYMGADVINLKTIQLIIIIITDANHSYYSSQSTTDLLWKLLFVSLFYYPVYSKEINKLVLVNFYIKRPKASGIQSEDKTAAHDRGISLAYNLSCITTPHNWWTAD